MKKINNIKFIILLIAFISIENANAGFFDWVPRPKAVFNSVVNSFGDVWSGVNDLVIDPLVNISSEGIDFVTRQVVNTLGLSPDITKEVNDIVNATVRRPYNIQVTPAEDGDIQSRLMVFTDPGSQKIIFQDLMHLTTINIPGSGHKNIPTMGYFESDGTDIFVNEPRGIATDRQRNFWVADVIGKRIIWLLYDPISKNLKFQGSLVGASHPYGISYSRGFFEGSGDDFLYVTNSVENTICKVSPKFGREEKIFSPLNSVCTDNINGVRFNNPIAITTEDNGEEGATGSPTTFYLAYDKNKISKILDDGIHYTVLSTLELPAGTPSDITGLATDLKGNLYAVDSLGSKVVYISSSGSEMKVLYTFGEPGVGSSANSIKFNHPKGIAVSGEDLHVVESWTTSSGLQKFKAVPTIDRNNTDVLLVPISGPEQMVFNLNLSSDAKIDIKLELTPDLTNLSNRIVVYQETGISVKAGKTLLTRNFKGNIGDYFGLNLIKGGLYNLVVTAYLPANTTTPTDVYSKVTSIGENPFDFAVYMRDVSAPSFNGSVPEIFFGSLAENSYQNITVRLWLSKDEMPTQEIGVQKLSFNPDQISITTSVYPTNPNLCYVDLKYPASFILAPGVMTPIDGLKLKLFFKNIPNGVWDKSNDFSWKGISSTFSSASNVTIFTSSGQILFGNWPDEAAIVPKQSNPSDQFWLQQDIGNVGIEGSVSVSNGIFSSTSAGNDIWNDADGFRFVFQKYTGDVDIRAKVYSIQAGVNAYSKTGVMIRENLAPGSKNAITVVTATQGIEFDRRTSTNGNTVNSSTAGNAPSWVRLVRKGADISSYSSQDGITWSKIGNQSIVMTDDIYIGLVFSSHNTNATINSEIGNVSISLPPTNSVPLGTWTQQDIGDVVIEGNASLSNGVFSINATGTNIWNTEDGFRFVHKIVSGDVDIRARINSINNNLPSGAKSGLMIRENLNPNSANAAIVIISGHIEFLTRLSTGANTICGPFLEGNAPKWVRLTRIGNNITGYISDDGMVWTKAGSQSISMQPTLCVGMAVSSNHGASLVNSIIDNVTVGTPPPDASPLGTWTQQDIGDVGISGSSTESSGTFTINAAGPDIWNTEDGFRFVYKSFSGNVDIKAKIESLQNLSNINPKSGLMLRSNLDPNSSNVSLVVTRGSGLEFLIRGGAGSNTTKNGGAYGSAPKWVRLQRVGNSITGYSSDNGINWTQVGSEYVNLGTNIFVGMAVCSTSSGTRFESIISNVSITVP